MHQKEEKNEDLQSKKSQAAKQEFTACSYYKMNSSKCNSLQLLSKSNSTLPSMLTKQIYL